MDSKEPRLTALQWLAREWQDLKSRYNRQTLEDEYWPKFKIFVVVALVNVCLAAPIGYLSFYMIGDLIAKTPYGVRFKGPPHLYEPYDAREVVYGQVDDQERNVLDSQAPIYGASLGIVVALLTSLFIFCAQNLEDDIEFLVILSLGLSSCWASICTSTAAWFIMDEFWHRGINANWLHPVVGQIILASFFFLPGIGLGIGYYKAKNWLWELIRDWRWTKSGYRRKIGVYLYKY